MSLYSPQYRKCVICKKYSLQYNLFSTDYDIADSYLDFRPMSWGLETFRYSLEECPFCNYLAFNIEDKLRGPLILIKEKLSIIKESEEFPLSLKGESNRIPKSGYTLQKESGYEDSEKPIFKNFLADKFYTCYLLHEDFHKRTDNIKMLLIASWICDDAEDYHGAIYCRMRCLNEIDILNSRYYKKNLDLVRLDILRRCSRFDQVETEYSDKGFDSKTLDLICKYQIALSKENDMSPHTVREAVRFQY